MELVRKQDVYDSLIFEMAGTGYQSRATDALRYVNEINPVHEAGGCYCKECKYWDTFKCPMMGHYEGEDPTSPNDFCSYGERKEEK